MSKKIMLLGIAVILAAIALSINNIIAFWGGIVGHTGQRYKKLSRE